ncbi:MAG: zinc ribbon domain-containing protein [Candidatus Gottesmanbacteria bacterium]
MHCYNCGHKLNISAKFCVNCGANVTGSETNKTAPASSPSGVAVVSSRNKKLGIFFIVLPFATLITVLLIWSVIIFAAGTTDSVSYNVSTSDTVINIIQWVLGLVALMAMIGILVFVPIGIVYLNKKTIRNNDVHYDERSGKGDASEVPAEVAGWSWGAAGLTWIWGVSNGVWISLLNFVPILNYVWWIVLGVKGNEWAWKARQWESIEQFNNSQRSWGIWGLVLFISGVFINVLWLVLISTSN